MRTSPASPDVELLKLLPVSPENLHQHKRMFSSSRPAAQQDAGHFNSFRAATLRCKASGKHCVAVVTTLLKEPHEGSCDSKCIKSVCRFRTDNENITQAAVRSC